MEIINSSFDYSLGSALVDVNVSGLRTICEYIGIEFNYRICSKLHLPLPEIRHPGQWALEISDLLGAKIYINPVGGKDIFVRSEFDERGIELMFAAANDVNYQCGSFEFESGLSIIDVLMWNSASSIKAKLDALSGNWG